MQHQVKIKHHYIPKFHLNSWRDHSGTLLLYRKDGCGNIEAKRKHPSQVCFENHLYTLKKDIFERAHLPDFIENQLAKIDDNAARTYVKILNNSNLSDLTEKEKWSWAVYINSLLHRNPEQLKTLESEMRLIVSNTLSDIKAAATPDSRHTWKTCNSIFNNTNYCENEVRALLLSLITDKERISDILSFKWQMIAIDDAFPYRFILTESPVVTVGEDNNIGIFALALTPNILWVALPSTFDDSEDLTDLIKYIVMAYNGVQVAKKPRFIISSTVLTNDGLHNYDKIFKDCVQLAVGIGQFHNQAAPLPPPAT